MGPNPNGPLSKLLEIWDAQVFSGSVRRGSCWRFLGLLTTSNAKNPQHQNAKPPLLKMEASSMRHVTGLTCPLNQFFRRLPVAGMCQMSFIFTMLAFLVPLCHSTFHGDGHKQNHHDFGWKNGNVYDFPSETRLSLGCLLRYGPTCQSKQCQKRYFSSANSHISE